MKGAATSEAGGGRPEMGLLFIILVGVSVGVSEFLPGWFVDFWRQLLMVLAKGVGGVAGFAVVTKGEVMWVNGFAMRVANECTALNYVIILCTAILLYARHSLRYRVSGICLCVPVLVLLNAVRLVITGYCGTIDQRLFSIVHEYLWVALFAILVFLLWKGWADEALRLSWRQGARLAALTAVSLSAFLLMVMMMPLYSRAMTSVASLAFKGFMSDAGATLTLVGAAVETRWAGGAYRVPLTVEISNVAVFAALALLLQKRGDRHTLVLTLFSLAGLFLTDAIFIANAMFIRIAYGESSLLRFWFVEKGLLLAIPFALWWVIAGGSGRGREKGAPGSADAA